MISMRALLAAALVALVAIAGCLGEEAPPEPGAEPTPAATPGDASSEPLVDTGDGLATASAGDRAHKHDYWRGATEVTLVDADVEASQACGHYNFDKPTEAPRGGCAFVQIGNGSTVYQGTSKLALTVTWTEPEVTGVAFRYRDAAGFHDAFVELQNGVVHEIPVTMETADMPHTSESKWAFEFFGAGAGPTGNLGGPLHVTITIHRGLDLPVDPPHPDFWG
ncbi:MAG TPA: hypothetical protein VNZ52_09270, partial [Candidatus Thermoplasmatota archaeon]|nr:hypothetical protein [Candidatus Thermoplasmatota archaeon]